MCEKTITIKVPKELHKKVKVKIAKKDLKLKDYMIDLITKDLNKN